MVSIKSWKPLRNVLVILASLVLVGAIAGSSLVTVQADPSDFSLWAVVTVDPYWGYYGGYHDVFYMIMPELEKIGIDLSIAMYDQYTWWDITWETYWNSSSADALPPCGWDIFPAEYWLMPSAPSLWLESIIYSWLLPPDGANVFPYMNEKSDDLLYKGLHTFDASDRQKYLWDWQELFMHDPPMINIYYSKVYEVESIWLQGFDPVAWFMEVSQMRFNETLFDEWAPQFPGSAGRDPYTLVFGLGWEEVWGFNNLFMNTYTEDRMDDLKDETLYDLTIDTSAPVGDPPYTWWETPPAEMWQYCVKPVLAAEQPIFLDGPHGPDTLARIFLRDNVYWSDGVPFNASDVKYTLDTVLNPASKAVAYGELEPTVESVIIKNATCVDLVLKAESPDLGNLLSNEWGCAMVPWHVLKDVDIRDLKGHASNTGYDPETGLFDPVKVCLPALGPFKLTGYAGGEYIELSKNPDYFGYDLGWGPYDVDKMILKWIGDPAARIAAMKTHEIDFGEYCTASIEDFEALSEREDLRVWQYDYPASHPPLWLNLDSPYLSNRYVRQAIAHAIPREAILNEILPSWGVEGYPGKTFILPHHYYTDPVTKERVQLYNTELEPYENNLTKAEMYMDMWRYAQEGTDHTLGPVGDADFSGVVRLDDFILWATNFGTEPTDWTFLPGNDIDPDFDNSGLVNLDDFIEWAANYGTYYPFEGAR